jgi:O-antigen ligase
LAVVQVVPLPGALHQLVAPGSAGVWHPDVPQAAAVLGSGPRPISLHPEATPRSLAFATGLLALALAAVPALRERRLLLRSSIAIVAGGVLVAVYGFVARLAFGNKLYGVWSVPTVAPFGPFVSKNHFAGYVELAALLALGLAVGLAGEARRGPGPLSWIESRRARWVVFAWGAAAILILAVPVSQSRGGVLSLGAGLVAFAGLQLWSRRDAALSPRPLLAAGAVGALGLAAVVYVLPAESRDRVLTLTGVTTEQSGSYRLAVWRDTLRLVAASPWLGSGFGAYQDALPRFKTAAGHLAVEHAENDYLELLAEGGLVAVLLFVSLAAPLLTRGVCRAVGASSRLARGLISGAQAGLVALAVHSAFDFNLRIPSNALLAVALASVVLSGGATGPARLPRLMAPALVAATLGAALLVPWAPPGVDPGRLARAAGRADSGLRRNSLATDFRSHLQRQPADAEAWLALAWLRHPASPDEAEALAAWARGLDPASQRVREAAERLGADSSR